MRRRLLSVLVALPALALAQSPFKGEVVYRTERFSATEGQAPRTGRDSTVVGFSDIGYYEERQGTPAPLGPYPYLALNLPQSTWYRVYPNASAALQRSIGSNVRPRPRRRLTRALASRLPVAVDTLKQIKGYTAQAYVAGDYGSGNFIVYYASPQLRAAFSDQAAFPSLKYIVWDRAPLILLQADVYRNSQLRLRISARHVRQRLFRPHLAGLPDGYRPMVYNRASSDSLNRAWRSHVAAVRKQARPQAPAAAPRGNR